MNSNKCPCNSESPFAECCEPLLAGARPAATAESLMRSRYSAYLVRNVDYLLKTWHPSTRPTAIDPATIPDWQELNVIRTENGKETDAEGIVEFVATAIAHNGILRLHEVSRFVREGGQWLYLDGEIKEDSPPAVSKKSKAGRNDPCPCGSGKKFKKCCGA